MAARTRPPKPDRNGRPRTRVYIETPTREPWAPLPHSLHGPFTAAVPRAPGMAPSECSGVLVHVDAAGEPVGPGANDVRAIHVYQDHAQPGEGPVGSTVEVQFFRCTGARCGATLVVARGADGPRLRNEYRPSRWDAAARKPVDVV